MSAKNVREITLVVKCLYVKDAEVQLENLKKGSAEDLRKLLLSAVASAKDNFNLNEEELVVSNIVVQEGRTLKRWRPRAYGRAAQIMKRTCHVVLTVEDLNKSESKKVSKKDEKKEDKDKAEGKKSTSLKSPKSDKESKDDVKDKKPFADDQTDKFTKAKKGDGKKDTKTFRRKSF